VLSYVNKVESTVESTEVSCLGCITKLITFW
jgi:hypothetical protein